MKRKQRYAVTVTSAEHRIILVKASNRAEAKAMALERWGGTLEVNYFREKDKVTNIQCLGTAEKTKKR